VIGWLVEHLRNGSNLTVDPSVRRGTVSFKQDLMKQPVKCRRRKIGSARFEINMDVQILGLNPERMEFEGIGVVRN